MTILKQLISRTGAAVMALPLDGARWLRARCSPNAFLMGLAILLLTVQTFRPAIGRWPMAAAAALLLAALGLAAWRRMHARRHAAAPNGGVIEVDAGAPRAGLEGLRAGLLDALNTIKTSKLARVTGKDALYELPWYMIIGHPGAGKSSAIAHSGLQFPFPEKHRAAVQGLGGTRGCDWFFTAEGILLDTAGRYSVHTEDRGEWFGFLDLLKRHRNKAPVNGIIVTASIGELTSNRPEFAIDLAKNLRQRVQELTDRLEVQAPVYIMFTKADLIGGFSEFFAPMTAEERHGVWGATLPYQPEESSELLSQFDQHFDELYDGLKEMGRARIALRGTAVIPPSLLTFAQEFYSLKPVLRSFISTLFDVNPYQHKPVFRGFYFSSALQEGPVESPHAARIAQRFRLSAPIGKDISGRGGHGDQGGFFLRDLLAKVIFADKGLVRQQASPIKIRIRYAAFFAMVGVFGLTLGGWTWSYLGNRQLATHARADLDQIVALERSQNDLQSRLRALEILQDRITQLDRYGNTPELSVGLGLYQGDNLKRQLLAEYYHGVRQLMLTPVRHSLESFLSKVDLKPDTGKASAPANGSSPTNRPTHEETLFQDAEPDNAQDAYNALKTYLMLAEPGHVEPVHLSDQLARFWRNWLEENRGTMPRAELIRSAERTISFYVSMYRDPDWAEPDINLALVEKTRLALRSVMRGMPAQERAYATIKARAATRFAPMTVAAILGDRDQGILAGSYAVPGAFTRQAWTQYIQGAIREAANQALHTTDWVLGVSAQNDLTLEGSPEQIEKALTTAYKKEYVEHWTRFLRGISVKPFADFKQAVQSVNRLGDPETSPIAKLIKTAYEQTAWDNPVPVLQDAGAKSSWTPAWVDRLLGNDAPASGNNVTAIAAQPATGPLARQFSDIARLVAVHDGQSLLGLYMGALSRIRTRFNVLNNQGEPGPGALDLMRQTLEGRQSELADALQVVDGQMLTGIDDSQRQTLRPLLARPLIQAYNAIAVPAAAELNKVWKAQVYQPFKQSLASKYPFAEHAGIEATPGEIGQIFGPEGSIARFVNETVGPLAVRRGSLLAPRTWGDQGIEFTPVFTTNFAQWVAPLAGGAAAASSAAVPQTLFQIQPRPVQGVSGYTIEIDGQQLRYRNTPAQWVNFVWPYTQGVPGAKISATLYDGSVIDIINEPGRFGLDRLINSASRKTNPDGSFEMSWSKSGTTISVALRIISDTQSKSGGQGSKQGLRNLNLPDVVVDTQSSTPAPPTGDARQ
jgi:type VI secretion system protein ImpL